MHYYQFNIGDYHTHTSHLELIEDLAYRRMIDWCYLHESPLPESTDEIAKRIRMKNECKCIASVLHEFFTLHDDGYHSDRIDSEIKSYHDVSKKRKKAANKRWANKHKGLSSDANALQVQSTSNAKQEPRTKNQEPLTKSNKTIDQSAIDRDCMFEDFWLSGIRKVNKKKAKSLFTNLLKNHKDPQAFTDALINDVHKRLYKNQMGFAEMHPTTYLNGERWNDEVTHENTQRPIQPKPSAADRVKQAIARETEQAGNGSDESFVGSPIGNIRGGVCEPIRGNAKPELEGFIEGDFTRSDQDGA